MNTQTLKITLDNYIKETNKKNLINNLGYNNLKIGLKTLNKFLKTKDIYEWLKSGHYDLKYNSERFLSELCLHFDLLTENTIEEIREAKNKIKYINDYNNSSFKLEIITNWIRTTESITMLSLAGRSLKYINIEKKLLYGLTEEKQLELVKKTILKHYQKHNGIIPIFGNIKYYKYTSEYGKTYRLKINPDTSKTEIIQETTSNIFYFNIVEKYKISLEEVFQIDKQILDNYLLSFENKDISLYDFLINVFEEYLLKNKKNISLDKQKKEKEINKYIYRLKKLDKKIR